MITRRGIPVSPGVAIGPVLTLETDWHHIPARHIADSSVEAEIDRLNTALRAAAADARSHEQKVGAQLGRQYAAIFEAHALLIEDPTLVNEIVALIREQKHSAAYAVRKAVRRLVHVLKDLSGNSPLAERTADLFDIERRILMNLLGERQFDLKQLHEAVIVLAHDLTPSETAHFDSAHVHAFATEAGGKTSHTAIIAAALEIPAVVGLGSFLADVTCGDDVIVDGNEGILIIDPDDETRRAYEAARKTYLKFEESLDELRDLPATTLDGVEITLLGNIEFPTEAANAIAKGAKGIGLYRTEFLYLDHDADPTEEEHFEAYLQVLRAMPPGSPLVIRTLDVGADKFSPRVGEAMHENNPYLGLRSIRLCLQNIPLFKTQLRAILRASAFGGVRILFPMIATTRELWQSRLILSEVKEDLSEEGVAFNNHVLIGAMIEVPSAAILARQLVRDVDYLSIGTNDLVQYTLAADRTNEHVAELYSAADPAVLRLVRRVILATRNAGKLVNICGEMSGEPMFAPLLVGMGVRQFSVTPHKIPEVKRVIRAMTAEQSVKIAQQAFRLESSTEVTKFLREQLRRFMPDAVP